MNRIFLILIIFLVSVSCSSKPKTKLWGLKKSEAEKPKIIKKILEKDVLVEKEFNSNLKITVSKGKYNSNFFNNRNDTGEQNYDGYLEKIGRYKFLS